MGTIAVAEEGDNGPALLCTHGIPGSSRDFRYLSPWLAGRFRVVRVEAPGFGHSPPGPVHSVRDWAAALGAVADALGLARYFLLGHSFGGGPVLHAAAARPGRVLGVALLASIGPRRHRAYGPVAPPVYRGIARLARWPATRVAVLALGRWGYRRIGLRPPDPGDWQTLHRHMRLVGSIDFAELGSLAARIGGPALVAHCRDDRLVEPCIAEGLVRALPEARLLTFPTGGHFLQKTRAAELAAALCETLLPAARA